MLIRTAMVGALWKLSVTKVLISEFITVKLCTFDNIRETNKFTKYDYNLSARGHSTHSRSKILSTFLPFSLLPAFITAHGKN